MATTYVLSGTDSDLGGGADFAKALATATEADGDLVVGVAAGATDTSFGYTAAGVPGADGVTGDYTVEIEVEVGNTNLQLSVSLARVNSLGTAQTVSSVSGEQQATAGVKSFSFPNQSLGTWASGDRLRISYRVRNTTTHGGEQQATIGTGTADNEVVAPWSTAQTVPQALAATAIGAATLTPVTTYARSLSATGVGAAGLSPAPTYARSLVATAVGTASLTTASVIGQALIATAVGAATLVSASVIGQALTATAIGTAALATAITVAAILMATATGAAALVTALIEHVGGTVRSHYARNRAALIHAIKRKRGR